MRQGRPAGWRAAITIQFMRLEMPKIRVSNPDKRASTGSYSDAVLIDGWLYISGQGPLDLGTGEVVHGTIEEETRRTLEHIGSILKAADMSFHDIVKCTCHISDIDDFERFDSIYREFFSGILPARTTVQSVLGGIKVEIDAIARVSPKAG
jgi:2-iminobutanoate/2-iminopropanoate deaminase